MGNLAMSPQDHRPHSGFPHSLAPHRKVTVKLSVDTPPGTAALELACSPAYARDDAHWLLPLADD